MADRVKTIARDVNCDLFADSHKNIALVYGKEAYAQIVNAKMRTVLGELPLDVNGGLPYFQTVFKDANLLSIFESEVIKMLSELDFVKEIKSFDCNIEDGVLYYTTEILTDSGEIKVNG